MEFKINKTTCKKEFHLEFLDFMQFGSEENISCNNVALEKCLEPSGEADLEQNINFLKAQTNVSDHFFKESEKIIIESCTTNPNLKQLLILNRRKHQQLQELRQKVFSLLSECLENRLQLRTNPKELVYKSNLFQINTWRLGAPYFKDHTSKFCPTNADTIKKKANKELSVYDLKPSRRWLDVEADNLYGGVICNYNINKEKDIRKKLSDENCSPKEILSLELELAELERLNFKQIPEKYSNNFIDWSRISTVFLKSKHTALECQSFWHIYLHPEINRNDWTDEDNNNIKVIAAKYSYQNWDAIASELNTSRTGFITCLHYYKNICAKFTRGKFTPEEDKLLVKVVNSLRTGEIIPWSKIVHYFENRSQLQLYHRYMYFLSKNNLKKGKFTEAEDILLMILVAKFGNNFNLCAEYMPDRTIIQLRNRYNSNLKRDIKKGTFTKGDDEVILDYVQKFGEKQWSGLADELNRCRGQVRQRYHFLKSYFKANPNGTICDVPKRKHKQFKKSKDTYSVLKHIANQFIQQSQNIPSIEAIEEMIGKTFANKPKTKIKNQTSTNSKSKLIDEQLTNFFTNSVKLKGCGRVTTLPIIEETANSIQEILTALGVNLEVPDNFVEGEFTSLLDSLDKEFLDIIKSWNSSAIPSDNLNTFIPPNLNTLAGLKGLLMKFKNYKTQKKKTPDQNKVIWSIEQYLVNLEEEVRGNILGDREMYEKRFQALFRWPSILSLETPNELQFESEETEENSIGVAAGSAKKRIYNKCVNKKGKVVKRMKVDRGTVAIKRSKRLAAKCETVVVEGISQVKTEVDEDKDESLAKCE